MAEGELLIVGVGGVGCRWAHAAHARCANLADLCLIDADAASLAGAHHAHAIQLGPDGGAAGCAGLAPLAATRMRAMQGVTAAMLEQAELVLILTALGGGTGSGAAVEFARQAATAGCLVLCVAATPFQAQPAREATASEAMAELRRHAHVCVELSLDRLAWQARERGVDWEVGAAWVEEVVEGLMRTLGRVGLINLDLMDLRAIVSKAGGATMLVAEGHCDEANQLYNRALAAPLAAFDGAGASGCLLQVEGGPHMTLAHVEQVAAAFTAGLHPDAQVILGARITPELEGHMRVVAIVSGVPEVEFQALV